MKLIDADKLKEIIDGNEEFTDWQKWEFKKCIDACDVDYDVDEVVKELERLYPFEIFDRYQEGFLQAVYMAIEIVKRGGKS